jgi:hypothetical protein
MGLSLSEIFERYEQIKQLNLPLSKIKLLNFIDNFNQKLDNLKFIEHRDLKKLEKELIDNFDLYIETTIKIQNKLKNIIDFNEKEFLKTNKLLTNYNLIKTTYVYKLI